MPRRPDPVKVCRKCRRRQPVAAFLSSLTKPPSSPRASPFCQTCRETYQLCPRCAEKVSIVEFVRRRPPRDDICKRCFREGKLRFYGAMAARIAEREIVAGRDPGDHPGYRHSTQSPAEVLRRPGRRRRERLRMVKREPYEREEIFERDSWCCRICGDPATPEEVSIDHVVPLAQGGDDAPDNVRTAHRDCNSRLSGAGFRGDRVLWFPRFKRSGFLTVPGSAEAGSRWSVSRMLWGQPEPAARGLRTPLAVGRRGLGAGGCG